MIQKKLLEDAKKFIFSYQNNRYLPLRDSIFYLATYSNFIGSVVLNSFRDKKYFIKNLSIIAKDILYILNYENCKLFKSKNLVKNYDKVFVTWGFKENFSKDGSFNDRFFNTNSNYFKNTLWIIIYLDKKNPTKISKNILIFKSNIKKSLNIFKVIKFILNNLNYLLKGFRYYLCSVSSHNYFASTFLNSVKSYFNENVKFVVMPYESQPFQNQIISYLKSKHRKIKTLGYIHSPPLAVPANFIYKTDSPNKLILNGKDQKKCFVRVLGWRSNRIKILPSFRFKKKKFESKNAILLPLTIQNPNKILKALEFLVHKNYLDLGIFDIKNHPAAKYSKKNLKTIKLIKLLKKKLRKPAKKINKKYFIFIGNSGAIVEYLERGAHVIQICEHSVFDVYTKEVWPGIISKKIREDIYIYNLKKRGNLIKFGSLNNNTKKIFKI